MHQRRFFTFTAQLFYVYCAILFHARSTQKGHNLDGKREIRRNRVRISIILRPSLFKHHLFSSRIKLEENTCHVFVIIHWRRLLFEGKWSFEVLTVWKWCLVCPPKTKFNNLQSSTQHYLMPCLSVCPHIIMPCWDVHILPSVMYWTAFQSNTFCTRFPEHSFEIAHCSLHSPCTRAEIRCVQSLWGKPTGIGLHACVCMSHAHVL